MAGRLIGRLRRGEEKNETGGTGTYPERSADEPTAEKTAPAEHLLSESAPAASPPPAANTGASREIGEAARRQAARLLDEHLRKNAANLDRAVRMRDQAERLDREGTPSDSAQNRADRAREDVADGIARLRRALISSGDEESARALDLEVLKIDPPIRPAEIR